MLISNEIDYGTDLFGLFSFRYFRLVVLNPDQSWGSKEDASQAIRQRCITEFVVRHENFSDDLEKLADRLGLSKGALSFIQQGKKLNASRRIDSDGQKLSVRHRTMIREREWLLAETFGY